MSKPVIIGFGNKARHGKGTAASAITEFYERQNKQRFQHLGKVLGPRAVHFGFADELYRIAREEYGMKEKDAPLLQKIGNGRRQEFGADYWIKMLAAKIKPEHDIVLISDCRYWNEAEWIKSQGGWTQNITRLNTDGTPFVDPSRDPNHVSETELDSWNWDGKWIIREGNQALTAELAITLAEYLRGLHGK